MFLTPAGSLCCMVSAWPCCPCVVAPSLGHWHSCVAAPVWRPWVCLPSCQVEDLLLWTYWEMTIWVCLLSPLPMCLLGWSPALLQFLLITLYIWVCRSHPCPTFTTNGQFPCVIRKERQLLLHLSYLHSSDLLFLITVINNLFNIRQHQRDS